MLRTNLATRPFYNERAVRTGLALVVVLAAALTAFNALQIYSLTSRNNELSRRADADETRARELRQQADAVRQSLNRTEVDAVQAAAREANALIERRAFSWTDLFNQFEETLPDDVRIAAIQPQVDDAGRMLIAVSVIARRSDDTHLFMDRLEALGSFSNSVVRQGDLRDDGLLHAVIQGYFTPRAATTAPRASDSIEAPRNASQSNATPPAATPGNSTSGANPATGRPR